MNEFETGFEKPSLDNPRLFDLYAKRLQARASEIYLEYRVHVERKKTLE